MKTIIHVNQHRIKANRKHGTDDPVITVKTCKTNRHARSVQINGPSRLVYSPDKPLQCGARVWLETQAEVICDGSLVDRPERAELADVAEHCFADSQA
jgi:hypothetical protein